MHCRLIAGTTGFGAGWELTPPRRLCYRVLALSAAITLALWLGGGC